MLRLTACCNSLWHQIVLIVFASSLPYSPRLDWLE